MMAGLDCIRGSREKATAIYEEGERERRGSGKTKTGRTQLLHGDKKESISPGNEFGEE